jgi:acylphosphatase
VAQGSRSACERLLDLLRSGKTPGTVDTVVADWSDTGEPFVGFGER